MEKKQTFSLDLYTTENLKVVRLCKSLGWEGVGMYFGLIEYLYQNDNQFLLSDLDIFAFKKMMDEEKLKQVIHNFDLFAINDTSFYSIEIQEQLQAIKAEAEKQKAIRDAKVRAGKEGAKKHWESIANSTAIAQPIAENNIANSTAIAQPIAENNPANSTAIAQPIAENNTANSTAIAQPIAENSTANSTAIAKEKKRKEAKENKEKPLTPKGEIYSDGAKKFFDFDLENVPDWIESDWAELFKKWIDYRNNTLQKPYRNPYGASKHYHLLKFHSGGDLEKAKYLVDKSMNRYWETFFALDEKDDYALQMMNKGGASQNTGAVAIAFQQQNTQQQNKENFDKVNQMADALANGQISIFNN